MAFVNDHFDKKETISLHFSKWFSLKYGKMLLKNIYYGLPGGAFSAFHNFHIPSSMLRSTYETVWKLEPKVLHQTCITKFRELSDVNQYVMTYYQLCAGNFVPRRADFSQFYTIGQNDRAMYEDILTHRHKLICLNDDPGKQDIDAEKEGLVRVFEQAFPDKSAFER